MVPKQPRPPRAKARERLALESTDAEAALASVAVAESAEDTVASAGGSEVFLAMKHMFREGFSVRALWHRQGGRALRFEVLV